MTRYWRLLAFGGGLVTLGAELAASRLVAPYFGTSLPVWSSLIALILLALAAGGAIGGRWADRCPRPEILLGIATAGAVLVALVPLAAAPVFSLGLKALGSLRLGLLIASFFTVLLLMGLPMILLGCITPFAVRLSTVRVDETGRRTGALVAWSTAGSFVGALLPVLVTIPAWGTRCTFLALGAGLVLLTVPGYWLCKRRVRAVSALVLAVALSTLAPDYRGTPIKPGENLLFEAESTHHYIQVVEQQGGQRALRLNEGIVSHSVYQPGLTYTFGEWDYLAAAPFFLPSPYNPLEKSRRWAVIGSAAGTTARLVHRLFPEARVHGIEIDGALFEVGRDWFDMGNLDRLTTEALDGRAWLRLNRDTYDVIAIDAYRQPYIPFELTTIEAFQSVRQHLNDPGAVSINVASPGDDDRLVRALATTLQVVFPSVFLIELDQHHNTTILVGTTRPSTLKDFRTNGETFGRGTLAESLVLNTDRYVTDTFEPSIVLTDDHAPVERLMDLIVARAIGEQTRK